MAKMNLRLLILKRIDMKKIYIHFIRGLIVLCLLIAPVLTFAAEWYVCIDQDGNQIVTNAPREGMLNCVLKERVEDASPKVNVPSQEGRSPEDNIISLRESMKKRLAVARLNSIPGIMNHIRNCLNNAAQRKWSEWEKGRVDVKVALPMFDSAENSAKECDCPALSMEIAKAAEYARQAYHESSVDKFSDLLTKSIHAFNNAGKAYLSCK